jgi:hypothetical protein
MVRSEPNHAMPTLHERGRGHWCKVQPTTSYDLSHVIVRIRQFRQATFGFPTTINQFAALVFRLWAMRRQVVRYETDNRVSTLFEDGPFTGTYPASMAIAANCRR